MNWPQPAANAVTSVVDYWERVSGWVSCMSATLGTVRGWVRVLLLRLRRELELVP